MPSAFQHCDLTELIDAVGADFDLARDLLDDFVSRLDGFTDAAPRLVEAGRARDFGLTVRDFKGALLIVGAGGLAQKLRSWEEEATRKETVPADDDMAHVNGQLAHLRAELTDFISQRTR